MHTHTTQKSCVAHITRKFCVYTQLKRCVKLAQLKRCVQLKGFTVHRASSQFPRALQLASATMLMYACTEIVRLPRGHLRNGEKALCAAARDTKHTHAPVMVRSIELLSSAGSFFAASLEESFILSAPRHLDPSCRLPAAATRKDPFCSFSF